MSRDKTGKNQQSAQVASNNGTIAQDQAGMSTEVGKENTAIDNLAANPGLGPAFIANSKARNADVMDATFGGAGDALQRNSAAQGHGADDAGLYPQIENLAGDKARMENSADLDYNLKDATASLDTRRAIPGMYQNPANMYAQQSTALSGQNGSLISGRMNADNSPTFGQQVLLAGMSGASAAGAAAAGKP